MSMPVNGQDKAFHLQILQYLPQAWELKEASHVLNFAVEGNFII